MARATPNELDAAIAHEVQGIRGKSDIKTRYKIWVIIERLHGVHDNEDISEPVDVGPPFGYATPAEAAKAFAAITGEEPEWMVETP